MAGTTARGAQVRARPVASLPDRQPRGRPSTKYRDEMAKIRKKGKRSGWHQLATFTSAPGAAVVRREMLAGKRLIDGKVTDWDIETRRLHDDDGQTVGSALYVRLK